MGLLYRASCPNCSYNKDFCLGIGMRSNNLLQNIKVLSEEEQKVVMQMHENAEIDSFVIENKLTECAECNVLNERTVIKIKSITGAKKVLGNRCTSCGNKVYLYDEIKNCEFFKIRCLECKEALLRFSLVGHWD